MNRREMIRAGLAATLLLRPAAVPAQNADPHPLHPAWAAWKAAVMTPEGRIVDALQQGASHSESQGYGLLLAATLGDAAAFDAIDSWTTAHLAVRPDALLAWRWLPDAAAPVPDLNNASDGDLFYAWALVRAAVTLNRPDLIPRATAIAGALAATCIVAHPDGSGRQVLTPAAAGFQRETGLVFNPAYLMPLALREVAAATGVAALRICASDGLSILSDLAATGLMPDWIELRPEGAVPAADLSDAHGYDALRVPLFLIWSGDADHPAVTGQARADAAGQVAWGGAPTRMDRFTGRVLELSPDPGYAAIRRLTACAATPQQTGSFVPAFATDQPYYPATLHLMTLLAQTETLPRCVPL